MFWSVFGKKNFEILGNFFVCKQNFGWINFSHVAPSACTFPTVRNLILNTSHNCTHTIHRAREGNQVQRSTSNGHPPCFPFSKIGSLEHYKFGDVGSCKDITKKCYSLSCIYKAKAASLSDGFVCIEQLRWSKEILTVVNINANSWLWKM